MGSTPPRNPAIADDNSGERVCFRCVVQPAVGDGQRSHIAAGYATGHRMARPNADVGHILMAVLVDGFGAFGYRTRLWQGGSLTEPSRGEILKRRLAGGAWGKG